MCVKTKDGGCGEVVNASDCGSDIRGFDSHQSPQFVFILKEWAMAKWLRHRTLTPRPEVQILLAQPFFYDPLAQSVEHLTFNQRVRRSNRLRVTIFARVAKSVDALDLKSNVSDDVPVQVRPRVPILSFTN